MPVGNMIIRSPKGDIWGRPGTDLGPGEYQAVIPDFKPKSGQAPFSSTAERVTCEVPANTPGPGSYTCDASSIRLSSRPSPQFISKSERMGGDRRRLREMDTPGPGAYAPELVQNKNPTPVKSRSFHTAEGINWVKVASAPSIPAVGQSNGYEEGAGGKLIQQGSGIILSSSPGPGSYDTSLEAVKSHGRIYQSFGRTHSAPRTEVTPGPGAYDVRFVQDSPLLKGGVGSLRMNSNFASTTGRAKLSSESYGPGPGGYTVTSSFKSLKQYLAANPDTYSAFGSSSKNPRDVVYDNKVPGPGAYTKSDSRSPSERLSAQFASSSQRFSQGNSFTPGPGSYEDPKARFTDSIEKKTRGRFGVFGTTSARFEPHHADNLPPVGSYDLTREPVNPADARRRDVRTSAFKAPSRPRGDVVDERPLIYDSQRQWPKPSTTSPAFISAVPRFGVQHEKNVPGPGAYASDLNVPRGNAERTPGFGKGSRFSNTDFQNVPGPGSYNASSSLVRKTFNITIGDKW